MVGLLAVVAVLLGAIAAFVVARGEGQEKAAPRVVVTTYVTPRSDADGIVAGPDGALWFTNGSNNTIGRISRTGKVGIRFSTGSAARAGITAGPDGALWFTNNNGNSIGRISRTGKVTLLPRHGINGPERDHRRAGRRPLVHQQQRQLDRSDQHHRQGRRLPRRRASTGQPGSPPGPTAPSGSPTTTTTRSVGSALQARFVSTATPGIDGPAGIVAGPDGALWFTNRDGNSIGRISTAGAVRVYRHAGIDGPARNRGGA